MLSKKTNLLIVICHDLGQHLGCYGVDDARTPNIDAFAAGAIRFENSFCTAPQCSPSRAALYTGCYPHANGVVGLTHGGFGNDLNPGEMHLAQLLRQNGYETHLFGIQHEASSPERCGYENVHPAGPCDQVAAGFSDFLTSRQSADTPLFMQVGFFEPHRPFPHAGIEPLAPDRVVVPPYLPDIPVVREDLADMGASIAAADRAFGQILETLQASPIAEDTIVVFTADHGIPFPHAKMTLYDPGIEVALIMAVPGLPGGKVPQELISNVDVMPSLLDLLDLTVPENVQGSSFAPLLRGQPYNPNLAVFAEKTYHTYYDPMRAIRTRDWKLIVNFENAPWQETSPDYENNAKGYVEVSEALNVSYDVQYHPPLELYDLIADPNESHNLAQDPVHGGIRDELALWLRSWMARTRDPLLEGPMAQGAYRQRMRWFRDLGCGG